jgi:peptide deformylase
MSVMEIVTIGAPVLRQPTRELSLDELSSDPWQSFIDDLIETMHAAHGAGLAANQVGESVQICVIEVKGDNPRYPYKPPIPLTVVVNPEIQLVGEETFENYEGCLSVPNLRGVVNRHTHIVVRYLDRHGEKHAVELHGLSAGTFQHECDHLDGKLFVDRVQDTTTLCSWENFDRFHKEEFIKQIQTLFG